MVRASMPMLMRMVEMPMVRMARGRARVVARGLTMELMREKMTPASTKRATSAWLSVWPKREMQSHMPKIETMVRRRKTKIWRLIIIYIIAR